jgi:translation initiation factor 4E
MWEDEVNCDGGKWCLFLKHQFSAQYWEKALMALIGELLHEDIVGAVIAIHSASDLLSFWTRQGRTGSNDGFISDIALSISRCLELPPGTRLKFKNHVDPQRDTSRPLFSFVVKNPQVKRNPKGGK